MSIWTFLSHALDPTDANPCEDHWVAGRDGEPYPDSSHLDYDCHSAYEQGMAAGARDGWGTGHGSVEDPDHSSDGASPSDAAGAD